MTFFHFLVGGKYWFKVFGKVEYRWDKKVIDRNILRYKLMGDFTVYECIQSRGYGLNELGYGLNKMCG